MANRTVAVQLKAEIGQYVAGLSKASAATMRLGDTAKGSQAQASKSFDLAGKSALLMGGAVVAGLGLAISASMKFESSMSAVSAATQASAATMDDLRAAAMKAGAETAYSATEAADAITEMAKAGVSAKDIMGGGLSGALSLAAAGQMEVADAAGIASVAMQQFGLAGEDLPHVADLLAAGAGKAMGSVDDLGQALNQAGLVASAAGLSIEETTGGLAAFANAGLIGSDAGTSFRQMIMMLQGPTAKSSELMTGLGINMYDANGEMLGLSEMAGQLQAAFSGMTDEQRNAAMTTIFGADAVRAANVLYKEGAAGVAEWTAKVNDAGFAAETAAALQDNLKGDIEKLGGAWETLMIELGSGAQGPLREVVQALTGVVDIASGLIDVVDSIPGPVLVAVGSLAAVAALKGPVSSAFEMIALKALYAGESMAGASLSMGGMKAAGAGLLGVFGGPWGLALTGATVGLSMLVSWLGKSDDAAAESSAAQKSLADAIRATGGAIDDTVRRAAAKSLQDSGILQYAKDWGVASSVLVDAALGVPSALEKAEAGAKRYAEAQREAGRAADETGEVMLGTVSAGAAAALGSDVQAKALANLSETTDATILAEQELATATAGTGTAMGATTILTDEATKALEKWIEELQKVGASFVDPLATYTGLLDTKTEAEKASAQATADATADASDSWETYVGDVTVSLDELAVQLEEQLLAQDNWRANILEITQRGGLEVGQAIAAMGEEGIGLAAAMANGTDAEFQRMAGLIVEDTRRGGADAAAELDTAMKVMAEIGAAGGSATALAIAQKLGLGLADVRNIAAQYGVELATGLDPLLKALGSRTVALQARGGGMANYSLTDKWVGGYTGDGGKYEPKAVVHGGEYVFTKEQTAKAGVDRLEAYANSLDGYANGGFVSTSDVPRPRSTSPYGPPVSTAGDSTMQTAYGETVAWLRANLEPPQTSGGSSTGLLPIMSAARQYVMDTYGVRNIGGFANRNIAGTNVKSDHAMGKAIDIMTSNQALGWAIANDFAFGAAHDQFRAENVIWQQSISSSGGRFSGMADRGSPTQNHRDHVHVDTYDQGGILAHGGLGVNLSGSPERVLNPRETVAYEAGMRSREFSGVSGPGGGGVATAPAPSVTVQFFVDGEEFRGMTRTEINSRLEDLYRQQVRR